MCLYSFSKMVLLLILEVDLLNLKPTPYPFNCLVIALEVHPLLTIGLEMVLTSPTTAHSEPPFQLLEPMIKPDIKLPAT